jgi:hypothetical protein
MKKIVILVSTVVVILLSCTTVKEPTESWEDRWARLDAEWEAERAAKKQKQAAFIQPLSDPRFNGTFYEQGRYFYDEHRWEFDGTNQAYF